MIRPDVLVEVLRRCSALASDSSSGSNQLLRSALSILSSLAVKDPSTVLKSLMSVFTFMGAGLLARADDRFRNGLFLMALARDLFRRSKSRIIENKPILVFILFKKLSSVLFLPC